MRMFVDMPYDRKLMFGQFLDIVIDFGSSCYDHQRVYTYIQSRFYRAPEVMMGAKYGMPIDMWSLGCILAELLTGFPLLPGEDEADQMACIIELLGMPPQRLIEQGKRSKNFISSKGLPRYCTATTLPDGTTVLSGGMSRRGKPRGLPGSKTFVTALKGCQDKYFIDFIRRCLEWEPEKRLTPAQALRHAWLRRRLPRPPHDEDPSPAPHPHPHPAPANSSGGSGCGAGGRGGSLRTPLARTPVTFNASQVAKAKLQAALSEESGGMSGSAGGVGGVGGVGGAGGRCHLWKHRVARAWSARGSSWSVAASTSSASCAPTATPTPRSTTATTSSDAPDTPRTPDTPHIPHTPRHRDAPHRALQDIVRDFNARCAVIANISSDIITTNIQAFQANDHRKVNTIECTHECSNRRDSLENEPSCSWANVSSKDGGRHHTRRVQYENILKCSEMHDLSWNRANLLAYQRNIANNQAMASSTSVNAISVVHTPRTDSRKSYMSDIGNVSHCKFEGNLYKRNEPHGSSWSLSNINVRNVPIHNEANYPHYENIRRKSEDNIRKYNPYSGPSTSKVPFNVHLDAICTQPRESNHMSMRYNDVKNNGQAKNSVVHWTNSVENRVCCPETVLYGAVYGLKCLK
ncbi:unnamed protein product, partial [Brenthis ino]